MDFQDIDKNLPQGENMGGIAQVVYFGLHSDVASWPTKPDNPATLAELGVLTGNLTMNPGKNLFKLYVTDDTGELEIEPVGEKDGKSFVMHLRFFTPGLQERILGFLNATKNDNMVFIVPDNNGATFLLGDALRPATMEASPDGIGTSKETAGRRGVSMEFTYKTSNIYQYKGTIPLSPASS
jgi:hypothetical protein